MPKQLSDAELGARERLRRRCVIGVRLPAPLAQKVIRLAAEAGKSRSGFLSRLVQAALEREGKS